MLSSFGHWHILYFNYYLSEKEEDHLFDISVASWTKRFHLSLLAKSWVPSFKDQFFFLFGSIRPYSSSIHGERGGNQSIKD